MGERVIVVVDDDSDTLEYMEALLVAEGARVTTWRQEAGAFELVVREAPALVILDLQMERPDSGWLVLQRLREDSRTMEIPVIIYSGDICFLVERRQILRALGCDILEKPFEPQQLGAKIEAAITQAIAR